MGSEPGTGGAKVTEPRDPQQIRADIEVTRREMGDTVEALAAKADVKAQVRRRVEHARETAATRRRELGERARHRRRELGERARHASPDTAVSTATQLSQRARANPLPTASAGAFVLGYVVGRRRCRS